jgi:hypothetical protein
MTTTSAGSRPDSAVIKLAYPLLEIVERFGIRLKRSGSQTDRSGSTPDCSNSDRASGRYSDTFVNQAEDDVLTPAIPAAG